MKHVSRSLRFSLPGILALALIAACGKKEEKTPEAAPQEAPAASAPAAAPAGPIQVTGNDQMQFSTNAFEVTSGSEVTLIMTNVGTLPVESMGHNLVILNPGTVVADFGTKAIAAKETGYIPADSAAVFAHTRILGPGQSDTLKFTAPAAGAYPYLCSFPGHFAVMQGVMTVK